MTQPSQPQQPSQRFNWGVGDLNFWSGYKGAIVSKTVEPSHPWPTLSLNMRDAIRKKQVGEYLVRCAHQYYIGNYFAFVAAAKVMISQSYPLDSYPIEVWHCPSDHRGDALVALLEFPNN
jgi:hypothetical protein